jgi:hypothetical protein
VATVASIPAVGGKSLVEVADEGLLEGAEDVEAPRGILELEEDEMWMLDLRGDSPSSFGGEAEIV